MAKGSGTTKKKNEGFIRYVQSRSNHSYSGYASFCKFNKYPIYSRSAFQDNIDKEGIRPIQEKKNNARDSSIHLDDSIAKNSDDFILENDKPDNLSIVTETSDINSEAQSIANKYNPQPQSQQQTSESGGAPVISSNFFNDNGEQVSTATTTQQAEPKDKLDPEVFGYLPSAGINVIIKKFIDKEGSITAPEADQIKTHTIKLVEKYASDMAGEYATEINFSVAMTNPILRSALEKAEKDKAKMEKSIEGQDNQELQG